MKKAPTQSLAKSLAAAADVNIFARLLKVDVANRVVYGRAVQEVPDASGEIFDYKSSKPYFEKWVEETKEASGGKSLGNIRAMHSNVAAGKAIEVTFHDDECAIDIAAKVVDDNEWKKVQEGVYTGFSIGGSYVGKKTREGDLLRYTASPTEVSLVDKPCIPTALFYDVVKSKGYTVIRADGEEEHGEFKLEVEKAAAPSEPESKEVEVLGTPEAMEAFGKLMADNNLDLSKATTMLATQIKVDAPKRFADAANKKYPLDSDVQVLAAWQFANTAKAAELYDADALKALREEIAKAWEERFGDKPGEVSDGDATKSLAGELLQKSFYTVASAASMLQSLAYFLEDMRYWQAVEESQVPDSVPAQVLACVQAMSVVISDLIGAQAAEAAEGSVERSLHGAAVTLRKVAGAETPEQGVAAAQKVHDLLLTRGATCKVAEKESAPEDLVKGSELFTSLSAQVQKLTADLDAIKSAPRPPKAVMRVVSKSDETPLTAGGNSVEDLIKNTSPVLNKDGTVDVAATTIKVLHAAAATPAPKSA